MVKDTDLDGIDQDLFIIQQALKSNENKPKVRPVEKKIKAKPSDKTPIIKVSNKVFHVTGEVCHTLFKVYIISFSFSAPNGSP